MLRVYAPYCFASLYAKRWRRAFAVSHFAQSLDGRIATASGDSKWIGGAANRRHAHRMRALCDGILIGARTLARDAPQLTVREVPGRNPTRIVVGASVENTDSLTRASADPVVLIGAQRPPTQAGSTVVTLRRDEGFFSSVQILKALYQRGIYSVYIEGGAITTSHFLRERCLDVVQLHISPMVLGSGVPAFSLPPIQRVTDSLRFVSSLYVPVDDGMMFIGSLR
jgi:diaminohydroxyphosphoribosylaminopyrimidine deaminase/5-amino-6-(5-phosphoribosylamino)uracil reductase